MILFTYEVTFFFNDTATTEIYTLSLHDALPISSGGAGPARARVELVIRSRPRLRQLECAPPEAIADGVRLLRGGLARTMNVYLLRDEATGGVVVYDAGEKGMAGAIAAAAEPLGGISRVVLGHGDTDHRGAAP